MTTFEKSPSPSPSSSPSSSSSSSSTKKSAFARLCRKLSPSRKPSLVPSAEIQVELDNKEQFRRVFDYIDEDCDGKISPAELRSCVGAVGGQLSLEEAEAAVAHCSGRLGFEEFCELMETSNETGEGKVKELREAFGMYASKEESMHVITPGSLRRMLGRLGELCLVEDCAAMIRVFDLNGDGVLTFDEFAIMMR